MFRITPTGDRLPVKSKYQNICWCGQRSLCRSECFCRVFLVSYRIVKTLFMNWKQVLRITINCNRFFIVLRQFWSFRTGRVTPDMAPVFNQINLFQRIQPWKTIKPETGKFGGGIFLNSDNSAAESGPRHWPRFYVLPGVVKCGLLRSGQLRNCNPCTANRIECVSAFRGLTNYKLTHSCLDESFKKSDGLKSVNLVNNSCL